MAATSTSKETVRKVANFVPLPAKVENVSKERSGKRSKARNPEALSIQELCERLVKKQDELVLFKADNIRRLDTACLEQDLEASQMTTTFIAAEAFAIKGFKNNDTAAMLKFVKTHARSDVNRQTFLSQKWDESSAKGPKMLMWLCYLHMRFEAQGGGRT